MIRGFFTVVASVALFLSLLVVGISWDLTSSLSYSNVENNAAGVALNLIGTQVNLSSEVDTFLPLLKTYCQTNSQLVAPFDGYNITISCSNIANKSASEIINDTVKNFIGNLYHQEYSCNYWNCFSQSPTPTFLISQKSYNYWKKILELSILVSALLSAGLFFLVRKKQNFPFVIGATAAVSSLPLLGIQKLISTLPGTLSMVVKVFLSQSNVTFWRMIAISGAILFIGLVLKIFEAESKIYNFFSKFSKNKSEKENPASEKNAKPKTKSSGPKKNL